MATEPEANALYLDRGKFTEWYVGVAGDGRVEAAVEGAQAIATSVVAYAEARAALARRPREKDFTASEYRGLVSELDASWEGYERLGLTEGLAREAGELAEEHASRGFDAVHLASALRLR